MRTSKSRSITITALALAIVCAFCAATPSEASAQEDREYVVGLFAPDIVFPDSVSKAAFIQNIASALSERTGYKVRGLSFARAKDFKARKVDFGVVSGTHFASSGPGTPIAYASGSPSLVLVGRPGTSGSVYQLKGKTLILPRSGNLLAAFVSATALDHEVKAKDFFKITYTKDVQSALAAVKLGQADATLAFAPYAEQAGLKITYRGPAGPMPVATQVNGKLDEEVAAKFKQAFSGLSAGGGGLVKSFGGGGGGMKSFKGAARSRGRTKTPIMADVRTVQLRFKLVETEEGRAWETTPVGDLVPELPMPQE